MTSLPPARTPNGMASEEAAWVADLRADGARREAALARLHALLLRAARFEVGRRLAASPHQANGDRDDVALQSADDALVAVLAKLDEFRGQSRFTTWAYKFALLEAAVKLRRRPWQGRELPLESASWPHLADNGTGPHGQAERRELLDALRLAVERELSPHQRDVLISVTLNGVPIDVLAERLGTTRGALYKTIHDARRKLRTTLEAEGHLVATGSKGDA
jgi:RNA polymerase sigma-70 factor (ECF subfamily)